ncbi:amino acid adenylation domain-containing protein [Rhizobium sp. ERR 1071]|uniref:amino acid adenylation domain-containing protein n=1 Tax=Rhizobium sp. ERR 1071 TaxID=2572677 RepID=UPI00119B873E|nr:amino acid adenylation domain-containing protein [Rhizobium sp. ERR1071]TWB09560.1 amino acid adenylation domain-containing protein [Rhizobium sp. ERR1071]
MTLDQRLLASARQFRERPAITAAGVRASYKELFSVAVGVCGRLEAEGVKPGQLIAVYGERSFATYASILGILLAGCGYVPLNVAFPEARNSQILSSSAAAALLVDRNVADEAIRQIGPAATSLPVLGIDPPPEQAASGDAFDTFVSRRALTTETIAYLLFTSGTTGVPKGVPISAGNLTSYIDAVHRLIPIDCSDRVLQAADLTFDLSVHDMMLCWLNGAELVVAPQNGAILAPRLIRTHEITACLIVPSAAAKAIELGLVSPDSMPSLKYSLFAGEALPVSLSRKWHVAAPSAALYNMYGPTESTIHTSHYRVDPQDFYQGSVTPIGWPIDGQRISIRDADGGEVQAGDTGEIWLSGPQMTEGYWNAPALTAEKFAFQAGQRWYRTGDLGRWDPQHGIIFAGRVDRQVKILGYRIELQDVEAALAKAAGTEQVAAIVRLKQEGGSDAIIVGFIAGRQVFTDEIKAGLRGLLPYYMLPREMHFIADLPVNANGKIDYRALEKLHDSLRMAAIP